MPVAKEYGSEISKGKERYCPKAAVKRLLLCSRMYDIDMIVQVKQPLNTRSGIPVDRKERFTGIYCQFHRTLIVIHRTNATTAVSRREFWLMTQGRASFESILKKKRPLNPVSEPRHVYQNFRPRDGYIGCGRTQSSNCASLTPTASIFLDR